MKEDLEGLNRRQDAKPPRCPKCRGTAICDVHGGGWLCENCKWGSHSTERQDAKPSDGVDANDAPDGYVAKSVLDPGNCHGCVFVGNTAQECQKYACMPYERKDRKSVIFIKQQDAKPHEFTVKPGTTPGTILHVDGDVMEVSAKPDADEAARKDSPHLMRMYAAALTYNGSKAEGGAKHLLLWGASKIDGQEREIAALRRENEALKAEVGDHDPGCNGGLNEQCDCTRIATKGELRCMVAALRRERDALEDYKKGAIEEKHKAQAERDRLARELAEAKNAASMYKHERDTYVGRGAELERERSRYDNPVLTILEQQHAAVVAERDRLAAQVTALTYERDEWEESSRAWQADATKYHIGQDKALAELAAAQDAAHNDQEQREGIVAQLRADLAAMTERAERLRDEYDRLNAADTRHMAETDAARADADALRRFKEYTHKTLDDAGVPTYADKDCRIGARLHHLIGDAKGADALAEALRKWRNRLSMLSEGSEELHQFVVALDAALAAHDARRETK